MTAPVTDWRALPAGRAMDAMVAERVLNATIHEGQHDDYMTLPGERPVSDQRPVPAYSTDIAAAWLVLGTLHGDTERWAAFTTALDITLRSMGAAALHELVVSRAAYAICRAALLAWEAPR